MPVGTDTIRFHKVNEYLHVDFALLDHLGKNESLWMSGRLVALSVASRPLQTRSAYLFLARKGRRHDAKWAVGSDG
jgi:hypothetical protein